MTLATETRIRGLATVRYLYDLALQQSRQPGLRRGAAILTFHDTVEMFLVLALQEHDEYSARKTYNFRDYWIELEKAGVNVTQAGTMESLNKVRVEFKHHAIPPSAGAVENARVNVRDFLVENTAIVFSMNFEDISMASAVSFFERTRTYLEQAESLIAAGQYDDALGKLAVAFQLLLADYEASRQPGRSRMFRYAFGGFFTELDFRSMERRGGPSLPGPIADALHDFARSVHDRFTAIVTELEVIGLGIDYQRHARFVDLTPMVVTHGREDPDEWGRTEPDADKPATLEGCRFCFDFVIDSALRLQETVYEE
jgi:hypothetical protein